MSEQWSEVDAELVATMTSTEAQLAEDLPFRIALLGDWSGRASRRLFASTNELANWRSILVDRDNLDPVMARLGVGLSLSLADSGAETLTLNFSALDDFHPDQLFKQLDIFEKLRLTRAKLNDPRTFAETAQTVRGWTEPGAEVHTADPEPPSSESPVQKPISQAQSGADLLDQILEGAPAASRDTSRSTSISPEVAALAQEVVKPYVTADNEAERKQLTAAVDARIAKLMNSILHHPDFQALESAWRALDFLVMRLDTGARLKVYLLDISFAEFRSDVRSNEDFHTSALYRLLAEQTVGTAGGIPWALVCANYTFDFAGGDPGLIERVSQVAREAGAPFVAGATPHLLGCKSLVETPDAGDWQFTLDSRIEQWWKSLTGIPTAAYVGFALPRFLLRLPYGKETEPTEQIDFEEMPENETIGAVARHESYLWSNPAFAVALLMGKGFSNSGWDLRPGDFLEVEGLPLHVFKRNGDTEIKPCAEVLLTLRAAERIIDRGLMPFLSMKDSDSIRLGMCQSIARTQLAGRWGRFGSEL